MKWIIIYRVSSPTRLSPISDPPSDRPLNKFQIGVFHSKRQCGGETQQIRQNPWRQRDSSSTLFLLLQITTPADSGFKSCSLLKAVPLHLSSRYPLLTNSTLHLHCINLVAPPQLAEPKEIWVYSISGARRCKSGFGIKSGFGSNAVVETWQKKFTHIGHVRGLFILVVCGLDL